MKPTVESPTASRCVFTNVIKAAATGVDALVPHICNKDPPMYTG